jgi:hypothetical protein
MSYISKLFTGKHRDCAFAVMGALIAFALSAIMLLALAAFSPVVPTATPIQGPANPIEVGSTSGCAGSLCPTDSPTPSRVLVPGVVAPRAVVVLPTSEPVAVVPEAATQAPVAPAVSAQIEAVTVEPDAPAAPAAPAPVAVVPSVGSAVSIVANADTTFDCLYNGDWLATVKDSYLCGAVTAAADAKAGI